MIKIQNEKFNSGKLIDNFLERNLYSGGFASFIGKARNSTYNNGQKFTINRIELEHYPEMAEKQIKNIVNNAQNRWEIDNFLIIHRYGIIWPGEPIVLICTASTHRKEALESCEYIIDFLKTEAPFWKKEVMSNNYHWVESKEDDKNKKELWK